MLLLSTTIGMVLKNRARMNPDLEAIITAEVRWTYKEFNERVNQLAHYLLEHGIRKGDRVALLCLTDHPFATIFMAAAKIGAIAVPLNFRLQPAELEGIVQDSEPSILFYDGEFSDQIKGLESAESLQHLVQVSFNNDLHPDYASVFQDYPASEPNVEIQPEEPFCLTYTSGTTGKPKGVISTHQNWFTSGVNTFVPMGFRSGDRLLIPTPLFHISGIVALTSPSIMGYTLVLMPRFHPVHIWDLAEQERVTHIFSVPVMLKFMFSALIDSEREVETLREILTGGSLVPTELIHQYETLGFPLTVIYGASEFSGLATFWTQGMGEDKKGSVGKLLIGEMKIIDSETGEELPEGEVGEIVLRGPQTFQGYWNNPEETRKVLQEGWYHTGDAGKIDRDGFLYVVDRYKDVVHVSGEKVFPAQVEAVIQEIDEVSEVAVVAVKDKMWGELSRAYVVKKEGAVIAEKEILRYTHSKLARYKLSEVTFVDELPKNSVGKVLKYRLREQAEADKGITAS